MLKIMLSSTYIDLIDYRAKTLEALENIQHIIQAMELFDASHEKPLDICLKEAKESNIFICVVAWRYGSIDKRTGKSITQLEYEAAYQRKIPCLVFLLDDNLPWPVKFIDRGEKGEKLLKFREMLGKNHTPKYFTKPEELAVDVIISLKNYLPEFANEKLRKRAYWEKLDILYKLREPNLRPEVPTFDASLTNLEIIDKVEKDLKSLKKLHEMIDNSYDRMEADLKDLMKKLNFGVKKLKSIPYYENPFFERDWEIRVLGLNNFYIYLKCSILQLKVRALEREVVLNPKNKKLISKLKKAKNDLKVYFKNTYAYD